MLTRVGQGNPRERSAIIVLVALLAGLALGIVAVSSGSEAALRAARIVEPVGTLWVNAIRMTVIPLIVSSLIVAVAGAEPRTVGRLGTRAFFVFLFFLLVFAVYAVVVVPLAFRGLVIDPVVASSIRATIAPVMRPEVPTFSTWVTNLVPVNPFKAAVDGAMLPLVVFTLAFGLALGRVESSGRAGVVSFFDGVAAATTILVQWVLALAPIGVFALALTLAARLGTSVIGAVGYYLVAHSVVHIAATALVYLIIAVFAGSRLMRFARAAVPAQVVGMSSRSSMAALPVLFTAADGLRIPRAVTSFVLPLATSTFRLNQPTTWLVSAVFAAKLYGVELGTAPIVTLAVTAVLMSFSVPGIPSGGLFIIAPFLVSVGIPPEAVGVLIALDLIPDVFKTLLNVTSHLAAVVMIDGGETAASATGAEEALAP